MKKIFSGLITAVCLLCMALVMLNDQLAQKTPGPRLSSDQNGFQFPELPKLPDLPGLSDSPATNDTSVQQAAKPHRELPPLPETLDAPEEQPALTTGSSVRNPVQMRQEHEASPRTETASTITLTASAEIPLSRPAPEPEQVTEHAAAAIPLTSPRAKETAVRPAADAGAAQRPAEKKQASRAQDTKPAKPAKDGAAIHGSCHIIVYTRDKGATIRIQGSQAMAYKQMVLTDPERVVIDLIGVWDVQSPGIPKNLLVSGVRLGHFPNRTRIVVDLQKKPRKTGVLPSTDGKQVDVRVDS